MLRSATSAAALVVMFAWLPGCGPKTDAATPPSPSAEPDAPKGDAPAAGSGEPSAEAAPSGTPEAGKADAPAEAAPSDAASLARDFLKSGGRRIGYSATKKMFAYPLETRKETGFSLDIHFMSEDGNLHDAMRVCQFGECEEHLDEIKKDFVPKLSSRLESDGYVSIRGIGWPDARDELEVSSLKMKLHYTKGKMEVLREGKPALGLGAIGKRIDAKSPLAVFVVPDKKFMAVFAQPGDAKGVVQELYLVKLP